MPRTITLSLLANMLSPSPTDGIMWLLHTNWDDGINSGDIRLALHDEEVVSNGNTYSPGSFGIELPNEDSADISMLEVTMQDAGQEIRRELRKLDSRYPANVTLIPVLISNPNIAAMASFSGLLRNMRIGRIVISGSVETFRNMSNEPAVQYIMSPTFGFNSIRG